MAEMWPLTRAWYGDRLDPDFRPADVGRLRELLRDAGLTGDFWTLPQRSSSCATTG